MYRSGHLPLLTNVGNFEPNHIYISRYHAGKIWIAYVNIAAAGAGPTWIPLFSEEGRFTLSRYDNDIGQLKFTKISGLLMRLQLTNPVRRKSPIEVSRSSGTLDIRASSIEKKHLATSLTDELDPLEEISKTGRTTYSWDDWNGIPSINHLGATIVPKSSFMDVFISREFIEHDIGFGNPFNFPSSKVPLDPNDRNLKSLVAKMVASFFPNQLLLSNTDKAIKVSVLIGPEGAALNTFFGLQVKTIVLSIMGTTLPHGAYWHFCLGMMPSFPQLGLILVT